MENTRAHRDAIRQAMKPIGQFFDSHGVVYAVVGSISGLSHGYGRPTTDVDVLTELRAELADEMQSLFEGEYYVDAASIRDAVRHKSSCNLYHFPTGIKIDIFVSKNRPFDATVTQRRELETMDDDVTPAFFVQSAEDMVLSKLAWYRQGGGASDRQWNDVLAVLKIQILNCDRDYLEKWAPELGVSDLLEKALDEAGYNE